jgi:hypothetical protein
MLAENGCPEMETAMRALVLDDEAIQKVAQVMAYARQHVFYPDSATYVPGDNPEHVCELNTYRCVFTYTNTDSKLYRHLSISIPSKDYPSPEAVCAIAGLFEFTGADQPIGERLRSGDWLMHMVEQEPHCIVLAEELK